VQLVLAVEYFHSKGVVHGGQSTLFMSLQPYAKTIPTSDLHTGNVLLRLRANFDQLSIDQLYEKYGSPVSEPIVRFDGQPLQPGVPSSAVPPIWLGKASEEFSPSEYRILLSDFGEAYRPLTEHRCGSHAPLVLCAS
jgi:hypothetical protein